MYRTFDRGEDVEIADSDRDVKGRGDDGGVRMRLRVMGKGRWEWGGGEVLEGERDAGCGVVIGV